MQPDARPPARPFEAVHGRNLPHLQACGKSLFITFCTLTELPFTD
jgi:hypothetical protein